jgi:hypothetical protein
MLYCANRGQIFLVLAQKGYFGIIFHHALNFYSLAYLLSDFLTALVNDVILSGQALRARNDCQHCQGSAYHV